jgi:hypothetical protein
MAPDQNLSDSSPPTAPEFSQVICPQRLAGSSLVISPNSLECLNNSIHFLVEKFWKWL